MTAMAERPTTPKTAPAVTAETTAQKAARYVWAGVRIALGWTFLWAFLDKTFGLGYATPEQNAWIDGGSPTKGFLGNAAAGPFQDFYHNIAGDAWADWLFMIGLAGIGIALLLGIGVRIAAVAGAILYVMMWTVVLPPENNPFMDEHLIFAGVLAGLALVGAGNTLGLGKYWTKLPIVKRETWLH
ncbi:DoxX family membrane protein [Phytohabitans aurantiacus]|uniref:Membrane protein n=1 Tax=Phytohabitans aurantiacus TaxID=3016789 RepID=A0ABQ5R1C3_9ACTN|nr:DoxX family membrane protein [Phytohabitans aurantiacus]GLH99734.1 membrane protein [Phytohabitans aurantiacus]